MTLSIPRPDTPLSITSRSSSHKSLGGIDKLKQMLHRDFTDQPLIKEFSTVVMQLLDALVLVLTDGLNQRGVIFSEAPAQVALSLVAQVTIKSTMDSIQQYFTDSQSAKEALQAWIIVALNEGLLGNYLKVLKDNNYLDTSYSENSLLRSGNLEELINCLNDLLAKTEFQLHLEEFMEFCHRPEKSITPSNLSESARLNLQINSSGSIISRSSLTLNQPPGLVDALDYEVKPLTPTLSSKTETPKLMAPIPIAPNSPLINEQTAVTNNSQSIIYTLWNKATNALWPVGSSLLYSPDLTVSSSMGSESLLNIRDGITCGSLVNQSFLCPQCHSTLSTNPADSFYCEFSGKFYCSDCFTKDGLVVKSLNPFRVLNNWDFEPRPIYPALEKRLQDILDHEPFLLSPILFDLIPSLRELREARIQLSHQHALLLVQGRKKEAEEIKARLGEFAHLAVEPADVFTIKDLQALQNNRINARVLTEAMEQAGAIFCIDWNRC